MTKKLRRAVVDYDESLEKSKTQYSGLMGVAIGGSKTLSVPNRSGYIYVRLRDNLSEIIQAQNDKISPIYDFPVLLERSGNRWIVMGRDNNRYENWGTNTNTPFLPKHGNQHSLNRLGSVGADPVWVYPDQFMPLLVYPSGSSAGSDGYIVSQYVLQRQYDFIMVGGTGTPSLTPYIPTDNTAVMGLIYMDTLTGNPGLLVGSGTPFDPALTRISELLPYVPYPGLNQEPLYAFRLVSGTSTVNWDNLYNARQFIGGGNGGLSTTGGFDYHNQLNGLQGGGGGITGSYYHLTLGQHSGLLGGGNTTLHSHSGTASDVIFNMDGYITTITGACIPYLITRPTTIENWYIYAEKTGLPSGTTIADVNLVRGGATTTIFSTQANRPMLGGSDVDHWATSGIPGLVNFIEGDILYPDIDQIATGTSGLVLVGKIAGVGGGGATSSTLTVQEADGSPIVTNVNTIKFDGATVFDNGGGVVTIGTGRSGVVQVVETETGAMSTLTSLIPLDDTIPQSGEGTEWITLAITPTSASNYLEFDANIMVSPSIANWVIGALFQDANANALAAGFNYLTTATAGTNLIIHHRMVAGTTSATTFKIRIGQYAAGTMTINGQLGARWFGGKLISSFTITEVAL